MIDLLIKKNNQLQNELENLLSKKKLEFESPLYRAKTHNFKFEPVKKSSLNSKNSELEIKYNRLQKDFEDLHTTYHTLLNQFNLEIQRKRNHYNNNSESKPRSINLKLENYYNCEYVELTGPRYDVPQGFQYNADKYSISNCDHVESNFICEFECCGFAYPCAKCHYEEDECHRRPNLTEIYCKRCFESYDAWDTDVCNECGTEFAFNVI